MSNMGRIIKEAVRCVRNGRQEYTEDGRLWVPGARFFLGGVFGARYSAPGTKEFGPVTIGANRVVNEGLTKVLNLLGGHVSSAGLFLAPWTANVEVGPDWTGTNFKANAGELIEYSPASRVPWTTVPAVGQSLGNTAALAAATITLNAGGPYTVRGAALLESSAKQSTTGPLIAAARYEDDLTGLRGGGRLGLEYSIQAMDESDN